MYNPWQRKFDWVKNIDTSGHTFYTQIPRNYCDSEQIIEAHYLMFNWSKCLSGVSFCYLNNLENIYQKKKYTGDGHSLYQRFHEYDLIDDFLSNYQGVDLACDFEIDTGLTYYDLDGVLIRPGQQILLWQQTDLTENGVYQINRNYQLYRSGHTNRNETERLTLYCKDGSYQDHDFFLKTTEVSGETVYPVIGEEMNFFTGQTLILKSIVDYDLYQTGSCAKVLFSDYDIARKQLNENATLYEPLLFTGSTISGITPFTINYHDLTFKIQLDTNKAQVYEDYVYYTQKNIYNESGETFVKLNAGIGKEIGDYIRLNIKYNNPPFSGETQYLEYFTFVKSVNSNTISLTEPLPHYILEPLYEYSGLTAFTYQVRNYNYCEDLIDLGFCLSQSYLRPFFEVITGLTYIKLTPQTNLYEEYFDYDGLEIQVSGNSAVNFPTNNKYINYKLYPFLNCIDSIFNSGYSVYNNDSFSTTNTSSIETNTNGNTITYNFDSGLTEIGDFRPFTFVNLGSNITNSLITKISNSGLTIETPIGLSAVTLPYEVQNAYQLKDISDKLYDVYTNYEQGQYQTKNVVWQKKIYEAYGKILQENEDIRSGVTGIIYVDETGKPLFKIYNENDPLLKYEPTELIFVGIDKKSRFPLRLRNNNFKVT
jgi:hypothetical protein